MIQFTIPGEPVAKGRPRARVGPGGKFAHMYTPQKSARFEQLVSVHALEILGATKFEGALRVTIDAYFEWPRSKWRTKDPRGRAPMTEKPDADNLAKAALDGLKAWFADQQVAQLTVCKWRARQGESPRTVISIEQLARAGP